MAVFDVSVVDGDLSKDTRDAYASTASVHPGST